MNVDRAISLVIGCEDHRYIYNATLFVVLICNVYLEKFVTVGRALDYDLHNYKLIRHLNYKLI